MQALNNWGLVLQELSALRPAEERRCLVDAAAAKFRRAIRQRPEFDRACYNLGTVYYALAESLQESSPAQPAVSARLKLHYYVVCLGHRARVGVPITSNQLILRYIL